MHNIPLEPLMDSFGRRMEYLRVSVTDRCNFRCVYCVPSENFQLVRRQELLSFEEICRVVRAVAPLGIRKVRLTGGEPLLRRDIDELVATLRRIPGIEKIALTTNGSLLAGMASRLKKAGLDAVNVSLDTLNARRFEEITLTPLLEQVRAGIDRALEAGLKLKVNVVALRGTSLDEVLEAVRLAARLQIEVRFIEFMPLCGKRWTPEKMLPIPQLRAWVEEHFSLEPMPRGSDAAETYKLVGSGGRVGFIASLSEPFCADCSRLRLSASGKIRPCLFSTMEFDLLKKLREGASDVEIQELFRQATWSKPEGHPYRQAGSRVSTAAKTALIRNIGG